MAAPGDFLSFLAARRAAYRGELPGRVARLAQLVADASGREALETLEREAHSLAGSAATFGMEEVGRIARRIELAVHEAREHGRGVSGDPAVARDLRELQDHAAHG